MTQSLMYPVDPGHCAKGLLPGWSTPYIKESEIGRRSSHCVQTSDPRTVNHSATVRVIVDGKLTEMNTGSDGFASSRGVNATTPVYNYGSSNLAMWSSGAATTDQYNFSVGHNQS